MRTATTQPQMVVQHGSKLISNFLQQHTQAVHGGATQRESSTVSKLEKLPRPTFTLNMTE